MVLAFVFALGIMGVQFLGLALSAASHLHSGGPVARAVYGAYLGVVMAHFVIDAGVWRLSEPFQRGYMARRFPFIA